MIENRERFLGRAVPTLALCGFLGYKAVTSLFGGGLPPVASAETPVTAGGSVTVESTMNGAYGGESVNVTCSGFNNSRVAHLAQGEGFSAVIGGVTREAGVSDGAVVDAIEDANAIDGLPQPGVPYRVPASCALES